MTACGLAYRQPAALPGRVADDLVHRHAKLVKRIAHHLAVRLPASVDVQDLIQSGMLGLIEAAAHYADGHGASFETYAGIRIRGAMLDGLRKLDWTPRSVNRRAREMEQAIRRIENRLGRDARGGEIAAEMGIGLEEYHRLLADTVCSGLISLDHLQGGEIGSPAEEPAAGVERADLRDAIARAVTTLSEREQLVLSLYYEQELNLKEIGAVLGLKESRICQIRAQALVRLRTRLSREVPGRRRDPKS